MNPKGQSNVGKQIRKLREDQGSSLRALSEHCGLSINAISRIERGENSPTVTSLQALAQALDVSISEFFRGETYEFAVHVKSRQGAKFESRTTLLESLGGGLPDQHLEPYRLIVNPSTGNLDQPISHSGEEFVYCLQGEIEYRVGDRAYKLRTGDSLIFKADRPHSWYNYSDTHCMLLILFQATGRHSITRQLHFD